jgi:hypothetical protein
VLAATGRASPSFVGQSIIVCSAFGGEDVGAGQQVPG